MSIVINSNIHGKKIRQFHEIVCSTGGRYTLYGSPQRTYVDYETQDDMYRVTVEFTDGEQYREFSSRWNRVNSNFRETKTKWYMKLFRAFIGRMK